MSVSYEIRKNTGSRCASTGRPEIGGRISRHRTPDEQPL